MIAALLTFAVLVPPPVPDYIPSGWKSVRLQLTIELGDGVRGLCFAHRVQRGETLAAIARAELGDVARADEIAAWNAGLDGERLEHDRYVWLPPAVPPRPGESPWLVYVDTARQAQGPGPTPFHPRDVSGAVTRNGELVLFLVPFDQAEAFERARAERRRPGDREESGVTRMIRTGAVTAVRSPIETAYVREDAPIARRVDVFRIERDAKTGRMSLTRRSSQAFDAVGEPLETADGTAVGERKKQALLLLSLGGVGVAGLWVLARRRRHVAVGVA